MPTHDLLLARFIILSFLMVGLDVKGIFQCKQFYDFLPGWPLLSEVVLSTSGDHEPTAGEREGAAPIGIIASCLPAAAQRNEGEHPFPCQAPGAPPALPEAESQAALGSYTAMAPTSDQL